MAHSSTRSMPLATAGDLYNQIVGFDVADDIIVQNPNCHVLVNRHPGQSPYSPTGADPLLFFYSTGTVVDATTDAFNFIKIDRLRSTRGRC